MAPRRRTNDDVLYYMSELTSRIVAETGIPGDRFHLGKILLQCLKDAPEHILQIDGETGQSETFGSALKRSVQCATCYQNAGMQKGDVIILMAPNHMDLCIPFYSAMYLGIIISAVDKTLGVLELQSTFEVSRPKMIFCQGDKASDVQLALNEIGLDARIISFDGGDYLCSFDQFMREGSPVGIEDFKPTDFDTEDAISFLISTSGTTGLPKVAAVTHKNFAISLPYTWSRHDRFPTPIELVFVASPLQWLTALMNFIMGPMFRFARLQTSIPVTKDHCYHMINTFKPSFTILSPTFMTTLLNAVDRRSCDLTCFDTLWLGGSAVPPELIEEIELASPNTEVRNIYGMSELCGVAFQNDDSSNKRTCGKVCGCLRAKGYMFDDFLQLVDIATGEEIIEPNTNGELWLKGPTIFKEYYNNPEATAEAFAEDRWFKTGDMFYQDEHDNYYFVERIKMLLKYKSYQISPLEIEAVIRRHPGVSDVAVTGVADAECGELPVACVVPVVGTRVGSQEIKDLVRDALSDAKQLRGGVIFMSSMPMTPSSKVHRKKLRELVVTLDRE